MTGGGGRAFVSSRVVKKAIDVFLVLHADHEQNASTSTVRIAGSSQANPYACVAAGVASLWGPAHGGANEAVINMLAQIGTKDKVRLSPLLTLSLPFRFQSRTTHLHLRHSF